MLPTVTATHKAIRGIAGRIPRLAAIVRAMGVPITAAASLVKAADPLASPWLFQQSVPSLSKHLREAS